jgi:hypothetical protein
VAGGRGVRETAAWFAVSRRVVLLAVGVVVLLALATAAALLVDAVEVTGPEISGQGPCGQGHQNVFLSEQGSDAAACQWDKALSQNFPRTLLLKVNENGSGAFQATATITTVSADPLVRLVQRGDGQDSNAFVGTVIGYIAAGDNTFSWSAPTVNIDSAGTTAVISAAGRPSDQLPIPSTVQLDVVATQRGTVQVTTQRRIITAVSQSNAQGKVESETAHSLTADSFSADLRISLEPGSPQPFTNPPGPAGSHLVARAVSTAWGLLSGFTGMLVAAAAWIAMFLASRMGAFGAVGRGPAWRRMERILGAVVIAHLVISACFQLTMTDESLANSLLNGSSLQDRLSRAMVGAGLWNPNQFPDVDGGVVLLIAFTVITAAWDPRARKPSPSRRRFVSALIALVIAGAAAVASYAALAYANLSLNYVTLPDGGQQLVASHPPLAVEIPVVTVCALLVMLLAAAWICGALPSGPASAGGSPDGRAARFPRLRAAGAGPALAAAAALIAMGMAAAIAYGRVPLSVDAPTLWEAGTLAAAAVVAVLLVVGLASLAAAVPRGPHAGPGPRIRPAKIPIIVGGTALAMAMAILVALSVSSDFTTQLEIQESVEGVTGHFSGTTLLIACLVLAAVFALAAGAAARPWRAGGFLNLRYWVVPLIAVLAVAAPLTNAGGYVPVVLRWGVLVVAGAFLGMAALRLTMSAVGPLRPSANRTPHALAAVLITAVIAVPWGELGDDVQVSWWDLLTYANRIDGVLPLVLVAAGVTALRRLGLVPSRDEATLSAHRRLGIAAWVVVLSGSYAFGGSADLAAAAALAAAAVAAWLLMPRRQVSRASTVLSQTKQEGDAAARRAVEIGVARRTLPGLAKTMREEVAAGKTDFAQAQEKVTALEERASAVSTVVAAGPRRGLRVTDDELAFGAFISPQPWKRAQWGAAYAVIAGTPWVLLGLAGASVPLNGEGYPELALISAVAPLVLRWAGYGLLFGYFFPLLRGRTGLSKSISFFAAAAAPSILGSLASPGQPWHSAALLGVQLLIFAMTMGLLADLAVLRKNGFTAGRLVDLHSLWTVSAWASSVAVAIGTGIATIILAGLQPFVIGVITPSPASTPPAATSHP